jgi:acetolactate synthase-1/3 small subunit
MEESAGEAKPVRRELALVRVVAAGPRQDEALNVVGAWSGRLLELGPTHFTVELSAEPDRLNYFIAALKPHGAVTSLRSGVLALGAE